MRVARLVTTLLLTAHGSADSRSPANTQAIAGHLRRVAPEFDVRVAFCEHNTPNLSTALRGAHDDVIVAPFLLAGAYHAHTDIPALIAEAGARVRQAAVLGEDERLLQVMRQRLGELGVSRFDAGLGVLVVAVGSSCPDANARTARVAERLTRGTRWAAAEVGFVTGPAASLDSAAEHLYARGATRLVVAPWFLAHGRITDRVAGFAAGHNLAMAEPLGAHRLVAATVLDRVEDLLASRPAVA
ncbi:MAG TPA: sirohydrochlorin chelatase [Mycolicibacillus parakoreensis]|uniref:Sirohydrochlorin chelatase n=1 Tax=Mycolicibacillus parakoreensis TaxID=1069221 RepID=A0ABY3U1M1_9MYCO|nr:sirohydrochlorin chelatase [Mycolicibacillus parakoreensis]ULN53865.1 sirohydrochlorin chelatase [Mycolicibacillus parakoreensis]HLS00085.1 sirohydrochlorin chelatase [Mycolicibacillus parakoreensis]